MDSASASVEVEARGSRRDEPGSRCGCGGTGFTIEPPVRRRAGTVGTAWGHTLYTRVDESRALIVSEPSDRSPDWEQVPDRHIVCARPGHLIITPIPMGEQ